MFNFVRRLLETGGFMPQEITQRKTAEEEVRRLNANLEETVRVRTMELARISQKAALAEAILKDSKYAVWTVDLESSITSWNSAAERLFGYPAEEVLGRPASMLAPPERQAEAPEGMARMKQD